MKPFDRLQTMAVAFREICEGTTPWVALGNFMNYWFDYAKERQAELVAEPLFLPALPTLEIMRWAVFCTASVEYLCDRYGVHCPSWVYDPIYNLSEPWFDSPNADNPQVREWLLEQTPEPFTRRNIFCGNRMYLNKYEFAEQYRKYKAQQKVS